MATAQIGDTVQVHYTGMLTDQTVFDSSRGGEPLEFTVGSGQLIAGFDQAVIGMSPGETTTTTFDADAGYGPRHEEMILTVDRNELPPDLELIVGQQYQIQQADGQEGVVTITNVTDSEVTLDANHALAGQDLTFEIELVAIL